MAGQPPFASQGPPTPGATGFAASNYPYQAIQDPEFVVVAAGTAQVAGAVTKGPFKLNTDEYFHGVLLMIEITNINGGTLTVKLQVVDPFTGVAADIPGAVTTALAANANTLLIVYPGVTDTANAKVSYVLPSQWQIVATVATATVTYGLTAVMLR